MAERRHFSSMKEILPTVLARIAAQTGRTTGLQPLWEEVAGPSAARACALESLIDGNLSVQVQNAQWRAELEPRSAELLERLNARLGPGTLRALTFRVRR